jgi:hypothetical protein
VERVLRRACDCDSDDQGVAFIACDDMNTSIGVLLAAVRIYG